MAVRTHDQIGFDEIGTLLDGQLIGGARVFGALARGSAVGDDFWRGQHG